MDAFRRAYSRRNVNLLLYQWIALDYVAQKTQSFCTRGTRKGKRSWRCLLRRIAEGDLIVIQREAVRELDNQELEQAAPPPAVKPPSPSVKRGPGRPIPADREPVPMPAGC